MIYLDNAATTGKKPDVVIQAVAAAMKDLSVNAGRGSYAAAVKAAQIMDECRNHLLTLGKMHSDYHVYFSPSATIAFNQLILGLKVDDYSTIFVSPFEHNAVMRPLHAVCKKNGANLQVLPFDRETWELNTAETEMKFLKYKPDFVFVSMVSNTTGFILPVKQITQMAHSYGAKVIVDCAQAFGAIDIDFSDIGAEAYIFAGHKTLYGPYGAAGFILKNGSDLNSGIYGGTGSDSLNLDMPGADAGGYEPGSANVPAICGLNEAAKWILDKGVQTIQAYEAELVNQIVKGIQGMDNIRLFLPPTSSRSSIIAFAVEGYQSRDVGDILDAEYGIAVRTGYQCAPLVHEWLGSKPYGGIVRASVGYFNSEDEVAEFVAAVKSL